MNEAQDADRWIFMDYGVDQWIVAAAHADDIHAMRCLGARVAWYIMDELITRRNEIFFARQARRKAEGLDVDSLLAKGHDLISAYDLEERADERDPGPAIERDLPSMESINQAARKAERREKTRWYQRAAQHGSAEALEELAAFIRQDHQRWHFLSAPRGNDSQEFTPEPEDLELCRTGASRGMADCMLTWAEHLRGLGADHQAEAKRWAEMAEIAQRRQRDQDRNLAQPSAPPPLEIVITAVITTALVPFIQAIISKAGTDSYDTLRKHLRNLFARATPASAEPDEKDQLLIIQPSEQQPRPGAVLQMWTDLPDEAITALAQLLEDIRSAPPAEPGTERRYYWSSTAHRWKILKLPPAEDSSHPRGTGSS